MKEKTSSAIAIKAKPDANHIFRYKFTASYDAPLGIIRTILSIALLVAGIACYGKVHILATAAFIVGALVSPVIIPILQLIKSRAEAATLPTIIYVFSPETVVINDGKVRNQVKWSAFFKVRWAKDSLRLYVAPNNAFVIPLEQLGENRQPLRQLLEDNADTIKPVFK